MKVTSKCLVLAQRPTGPSVIIGEHLILETATIDLEASLKDKMFIVKTLEVSIDPYLSALLRVPTFPAAYKMNEVITGYSIGVIVRSNHPDFKINDYVYGLGKFAEYAVYDDTSAKAHGLLVRKVSAGLPFSRYVGAMGMAGLTAYSGLQLAELKSGETLFVSAATGAVGQVVGQVAKIKGLRVIGSAGSQAKIDLLHQFGFDGAINYKTDDMDTKLAELCPDGIDVYYDNVSGEILDSALAKMNRFGRIICCGNMSLFSGPPVMKNLLSIVTKSLTIRGFVTYDYEHLDGPLVEELTQYLLDGRMKYSEDIRQGIESFPKALEDLLAGNTSGKVIIHLNNL
ncbi:NAD(P)-binding protein [Hesseltinella vesiculosa]|uniref:NAD(P)-binding protein n=1 Tax=Hesseltinella vesiculosa TaxID=101127 RepID=A0A1X2G4U3_9FUNG|nr:NAD(P)-binding protein [Hesseltinella vesiculosa]